MDKKAIFSVPSSLTIAGIPPTHHQSTLNNFYDQYNDPKFINQLKAVTEKMLSMNVDEQPRYLFLSGSPGCGKSHYMVGLYRAMVAILGYSQGDGALYIPATALSQELISLFSQNIPLRPGLEGYESTKWLFLDDFTATERVFKENSLEFQILRDLIIDRHDKNYCLITSSNLSSSDLFSELDRMFGSYVSSRLSASEVLQFPNVDFRKVR